MNNKFQVDIVTPIGKFYSNEVESISLMLTTGSITILTGHAPLIGVIAPGIIKIVEPENTWEYKVGGGFLEVERQQVIILADEVEYKR